MMLLVSLKSTVRLYFLIAIVNNVVANTDRSISRSTRYHFTVSAAMRWSNDQEAIMFFSSNYKIEKR